MQIAYTYEGAKEDIEKSVVIKCVHLKGFTSQIKEKIDKILKYSWPSYSMVRKWVSEFKKGRRRINEEPRSGHPVEVTTLEILEKIRKQVQIKIV